MKQQYKKIADNWEYIKRADDLSKTISEKAQNILAKAMYQINRYGHAILTHERLQEITRKKYDQNRNLLKQLNFILETEFFRCLIINDKKYINAYKVTLKENAAEILENPKKYFVDYQEVRQKKFSSEGKKEGRKNSASEPKKFSSRAEKIPPTSDSLHIYNKNKDKINDKINSNQNQANQNPFLEEKVVETTDPKIANFEYAEKSHNGVAREDFAYTTQAKKQAAETIENGYSQLGEPILLLNYVFTDAMLLEAIKASDKKHYTPNQVKVILRNLLEKYPGKIIFGGNRGFIKYLIKVINGETDYEYQAKYPLSKLDKATTMAEIQAEKQKAIDERFQLLLQGKVKSLSRAEEYYG